MASLFVLGLVPVVTRDSMVVMPPDSKPKRALDDKLQAEEANWCEQPLHFYKPRVLNL